MHFPSLAVLTTLACAAFSIAAPLSAPPITNGITDKVENAIENVPRDVPDVPATEVSPLVVALNGLATDLQFALDELVNVVEGKVTVEVDTNKVKVALIKVVAVVSSHVEDIKQAAVLSVGNVQALVVGKILAQIIISVYTALDTVAGVQALALDVLTPIVAHITTQLAVVVATVVNTVPGVVELVAAEVKPLYVTIINLSIAGIFQTLGVESPVAP